MRTRPRLLKTLVLAVPLALGVAACTSGGGAGSSNSAKTTANSSGVIVVGATLSLTGSLDALGAPLQAGYAQEIADVNAAGGVAVGGTKEKLKLVVLDNGSNPGTASAQAAELVQKDHAAALLGSTTEEIDLTTALVAEQLHVPYVTSLMPVGAFASGDKQGWQYSWDLFYSEQQQATDAARELASVPGDKKIALFTDNDPDAVVERPLYEAAFKAEGLDLVGDYTFPAGTTNFSAFITSAKASGAQLLTGQMDQADGVALWKQLKSAGLRPKAAFLAGAPDAGGWWQSLGSTAQGTLSDGYWSPGQASSGQLAIIAATLGKKYTGGPDYAAAALGYAVAEVVTDAVAKAGSTNSAKLNAAIARTDAQTTAGPVKFSQSTHTATTPYYVTQWQDGKQVQVRPLASGVTLAVPTAGLG